MERLIIANRSEKIEYKGNYIKHLENLLESYEKEYEKALERKEPEYGELITEGRPYNLTYRPGSYNIEPWRL